MQLLFQTDGTLEIPDSLQRVFASSVPCELTSHPVESDLTPVREGHVDNSPPGPIDAGSNADADLDEMYTGIVQVQVPFLRRLIPTASKGHARYAQ